MVKITLSAPNPSSVPNEGWKVGYRIKGTTGAYIIPTGSPFMASPIEFTTTDAVGTLYEGYITCDCGNLESTNYLWEANCNCTGTGFTVDESGRGCKKLESIPATTTNSGFCLAPSVNGAYSNYGSRIYKEGVTSDILLYDPNVGPNSFIDALVTTAPQWCNPTQSTSVGPMNREGVWIDSNCDGNKDALIVSSGPLVIGATYRIDVMQAGDDFTNVGAQYNVEGTLFTATGTTPSNWTNHSVLGIRRTTIASNFNNTGSARIVYIGVGGDNQFKIQLNGTVIVDTGTTVSDKQFKLWHLIPVTLIVGVNYFNVTALGDGSADDSIAMVVYDNTADQLKAATNDNQLNILFKTSSLRGTSYDVSTCPDTYNLDGSTKQCVKVLTKPCNTIA